MKRYTAHCQSGYYLYERDVTVDRKLSNMPYAQAGVINLDDGIQLVSYETIVAEIVDNWLHVYGMFSRTTGKHISAFLKEYAPRMGYYDAKKCANENMEINIYTGETRKAHDGMIRTIGTRGKFKG